MKKTCILLAGYPGTGKTYLANLLMDKFEEFQLLSPDDIKEEYWDKYGFINLEEKENIIKKSWKAFYQRLESKFDCGISIISDYPFSNKQKDCINKIAINYNYQIITIRLIGDLDVLYKRQKLRDLDDSRHIGHIVNYYKIGDKLNNHLEADNLLNYKEFVKRCMTRGYESFSLGKLIEIDVTDFKKVNYEILLEKLKIYLNI